MLTLHKDAGLVQVTLNDGTQAWLGVYARFDSNRAMMPLWVLGRRAGAAIAFEPDATQRIGIPVAELIDRMREDGAPAAELHQVVALSREAVRKARRHALRLTMPRDLRRGYLEGLTRFGAEIDAAARALRQADSGGPAVA